MFDWLGAGQAVEIAKHLCLVEVARGRVRKCMVLQSNAFGCHKPATDPRSSSATDSWKHYGRAMIGAQSGKWEWSAGFLDLVFDGYKVISYAAYGSRQLSLIAVPSASKLSAISCNLYTSILSQDRGPPKLMVPL